MKRALVGLLVAFLLAGCHRWDNVGGGWRVRRTESLPEAGGNQQYLHRIRGLSRRPVLEFTYTYQYFGDDCLGFASRKGAFVACGDRQPVELAVPDLPYLDFTADGAVQDSGNALCPWTIVLATPAELKHRAVRQSEVGEYDFDAQLEVMDLTGVKLPPCPAESLPARE